MKSNKVYETECIVCHTKFLSRSPIARYCPPCKYKVKRQQGKDGLKRMQAREKVRKELEKQAKAKKKTMVRDVVKEAEKHNMSYGQYVSVTEVLNELHRI